MRDVLNIQCGKSYDVVIGENAWEELALERYSKLFLVTDHITKNLYADQLRADAYFSFSPGTGKSKKILFEILEDMARAGICRKDAVVALGGGVVGDVAGFAAAIYMRGIEWIFLPTTLLSQVDSAIGGKTGIDINGKNLVGAFHHPAKVLINPDTLKTLSKREFSSGMAEVVKYAAITTEEGMIGLLDRGSIEEIITASLKIKARYIQADPLDMSVRRELNFGHTMGHALETTFGLMHGEAVALGMMLMAQAGENSGVTRVGTTEQLKFLLERKGLCTDYKKYPLERFIGAAKRDKKRSLDGVDVVLLEKIGKALVRRIGDLNTFLESAYIM